MEHKQLSAQGGMVHYWIDRSETASECIVFTHGLTADHTMFEKQVEYFSGKYNIILWDVPMHGLSRPYNNFSYRDTAEILHDILICENIEKVFLVGMSMGGYPSQHFGAHYPEKVRGFIALDTTPLGKAYYSKSDLWWLARIKPLARLYSSWILRVSMAFSVSATKYSYQKMIEMMKPLSKKEIVEQMRIGYEYFALENRDVHFPFPVLILVGDRDSTGKVKAYCRAWARQTGYPIRWVPGAKHFSNGDNPERVNEEIECFVREN